MSDVHTAGEGALSFEAAVTALTPVQEPVEAPATDVAEAPEPEEEIEADDQPAETAEDEAELADDGEAETDDALVVAHEAPKYWSKDAKARFAELPPELQAVVLAQEGPREEAAAKAKEQAANERQAAAAEVAKVQQLSEKLSGFLPQALEMFKSKWDGVDFAAMAEEDPAGAIKAKIEHDQEQDTLRRLAEATQQAQSQANEAFLREEAAKLHELAPELADPQKGAERRQEVAKYLVQGGIPTEALNTISAAEMTIAWKAMRWDKAQAAAAARPKQAPTPARPPVKASAATAPTNKSQQAANRFAQTRSVDDAVALLMSRGK